MILKLNDFEVKLSKKHIKNMHIRIDATGRVTMSAPVHYKMDIIKSFLQEKQEWINKHRNRLLHISPPPLLNYETGEKHHLLGVVYQLHIYEHLCRKEVIIDNNLLHCYVPINATFEQKHVIMQSWYKQEMLVILPEIIKKWENIIGVKANSFGIKIMKTRWGSCNTVKKRISINLLLIKKPLICLEYVVVHELVHLLEASHNHRFHAYMHQFMPNWQSYKKLLVN